MTGFSPDPAFNAGSVVAAEWALCHVRLQGDARFPWLILIPRRAGAVEIDDLTRTDRAVLLEETVRAGQVVRRLGEAVGRPVDKLNIAALGNVTAQLHVHVIGRRRDDPVWPDPVWGRGEAEPYTTHALSEALALLRG